MTGVQVATRPIGVFAYVGPQAPAVRPQRECYSHSLNETPSERGDVSNTSRLIESLIGEHLVRNPQIHFNDYADFFTNRALMESFKQEIGVCAQKRVASVFQQLLLAYCSHLHFEEGHVAHQAESEKKQTIRAPNGRTYQIAMDATHSSMIPCLYAYDLTEWNNYIASRSAYQPLPKPTGYVFMSGSDGYRFWNSTIGMPKFFNTSVDKRIDNKFRTYIVNLLNMAGRGEVTPEAGLKAFVNELFNFLEQQPRTGIQGADSQATLRGFELYLQELAIIQCTLQNNPQAFDRYLNIQVDPNDNQPHIRQAIFHLRYKAIQKNFAHQTTLDQQIKNTWNLLKTPSRLTEQQFRDVLTEKMPCEQDKNCIRKFFNIPYERALRDLPTRAMEKEALLIRLSQIPIGHTSALVRIEQLALWLNSAMGWMRSEELKDRASIMRTVRDMRGISRASFSHMIVQANCQRKTSYFFSESTIKRSEYGERTISDDEAKLYASLLKVDAALFKPLFFNSWSSGSM